jgi:hypothetical protein
VPPPLELAVEVERLDGTLHRWDPNSLDPRDIPTGITFQTERGNGFSTGPSIVLARRVDQELRDVGLLDTIRLVAVDGSIAYEGIVTATPRTFDAGHSVTIQTGGLMTRATGRTFTEIYVDRDMSQWGDPPIPRQVATATGGFVPGKLTASADASGLAFQAPTDALPNKALAELVWRAPSGVTASSVQYRGQRQGTWTGFVTPPPLAGADDAAISTGLTGGTLTLDNALHTLSLGGNSRYLLTNAATNATPTPPAGTVQSIDIMAVYGSSGIPTVPTGDGPGGVLVSDVIRDIFGRFVPRINTAGVQDTTWPLGHCAFRDPITPWDAAVELNRAHNYELSVWENGVLYYQPPKPLDDYDWELRLGDHGVTATLEGDTLEMLANGITVAYTDVLTGEATVLTPDDTSDLADTSPANPFNAAGDTEWTSLDLSFPTTAADAVQFGRIALAEYNRVRLAGQFVATGHIRNRAGDLRPVREVRSDDRLIVSGSRAGMTPRRRARDAGPQRTVTDPSTTGQAHQQEAPAMTRTAAGGE